MESIMLFCVMVSTVYASGQETFPQYFINPSIGFFRLTTDKSNINNTPLMIEGKIGIRISKKEGAGLLYSSVSQTVPTSGVSPLQPGGGGQAWTKYGILRHTLSAIGLFYERFLLLKKHFYFYPSAYVQYLYYIDEDNGHIVAGTDSSITYKLEKLHNYIGRLGVNLNLQYEFTQSISMNARFLQIDCRVWNKYEQNIFVETPRLLGVRYFFK